MSKSIPATNMQLPVGSLEQYIQWTYQVPLLTLEEEYSLAKAWQKEGDIESARKLVLSHLRFVVSISRGYLGYGLSQADLIQEGSIGLMKAVKRFDPDHGVRLVSFAVHWIKAEIHEFILRNWRMVKIATTKAQRKLFFNLRKATKQLTWFTQQEIKEVARSLDVSEEDVQHMEMRLIAGKDESFDPLSVPGDDDHGTEPCAPAQYLADHRYDPASLYESGNWSERLQHALAQLDERSRDIVQSRWLSEHKITLSALSQKHGVSLERIRQIEKSAMGQLKAQLSVADAPTG